jgi:MFS family permease
MSRILDAQPQPRRSVLWSREHRLTTIGLLLVVTLVAFESMGVATAMPTLVAELHGLALYSWPFTTFLIASVVATVLSGRMGDRRGPAPALLAGPALFAAGLVVAGTATSMPMLLAGRALQGLGSGFLLVAVSLLIALTFTDRERPVIYAANAAAWVLPAVIGPSVAGLITVSIGWRWVFLGLVPLVAIGVALLVVVVRGLPDHVPAAEARRAGVVPAVVAALGVAALTWAAQHPSPLALIYGSVGLVALGQVPRLVPRGNAPHRLRPGRRGLGGLRLRRAALVPRMAGLRDLRHRRRRHGYRHALDLRPPAPLLPGRRTRLQHLRHAARGLGGLGPAHRPRWRPAGRRRLGPSPVAGDGDPRRRPRSARFAGSSSDQPVAAEGVTGHFRAQGALRHGLERTTLMWR